MTTPHLTPYDLVLAIAQHANNRDAPSFIGEMRESIMNGASVASYADAIQMARSLGLLGADQAYFLLDIATEGAIAHATNPDEILADLEQQMEAVERHHGLKEGEAFLLAEAPFEYQELSREWDRRFDHLRIVLFQELDEPGMARDLMLRSDVFEDRSEEGWRLLHGVPVDEDPE